MTLFSRLFGPKDSGLSEEERGRIKNKLIREVPSKLLMAAKKGKVCCLIGEDRDGVAEIAIRSLGENCYFDAERLANENKIDASTVQYGLFKSGMILDCAESFVENQNFVKLVDAVFRLSIPVIVIFRNESNVGKYLPSYAPALKVDIHRFYEKQNTPKQGAK